MAAKKKSKTKRKTRAESTAKKSTAKKSTAKKSTAKKSTAKKSTAKKSTAKKSTAKKSTAKKSRKSSASAKGPRAPWGLLGLVALVVVVGGLVYAERSDADGTEAEEVSDVEIDDPGSPRPDPVSTTVPEALALRVVTRHRHDTAAFTQGLLWHDGHLYESTGLEGRSSLRRVSIDDGDVAQQMDLDEQYFAEGLARVGDELFQLTWQDGLAFVWDLSTFEKKREHEYEGEGWGLCFDGTHLVMSNGSDRLLFRDPETFEIAREVRVTKIGRPVRFLNELECVDGSVYANIWQREEIVRIDPRSGRVTASIDARGLLTSAERRASDVLNGIAWMPERERFAVTGKLWPWLFEVELVPRD